MTFPIATTVISAFLGWIMLRSGCVWSASVAHAANNLTQLNLTRLAFTGSDGGTLPTSSSVPIILAEAVVLLGVVVLAAGWRWRTAATQLAVGTQ